MKKITYSLAIAATILATANTYAQHGIGTNTPHRSAALHIESTNKGLLIPRVVLTNLEASTPIIGTPPNSLMVYHTGGNTILPGFYYWQTNKWIPFATGNEIADLDGKNGISRVDNFFKLGGTLEDDNTSINFGGKSFTLDLSTANSKFILTGLAEIQSSSETGIPNMDLVVYSNQPGQEGQVFRYGPNKLFKDYLIGVNGIKVEQHALLNHTEVSLGGPLTKETLINTNGNNLVIKTGSESDATPGIRMQGTGLYVDNIQGWHQIPNSTNDNMVIAVGHMETNQMSAATPKQVVDAGLTVEQTAIENNSQTLTINDTQLVTNYNNLALTGDVTGTINGNVVTKIQSIPVSETDPANGELLGYNGTAWTPVAPSSIVAAGISADNGLTITNNNVVGLGGTLTRETVINTAGNAVKIQGLQLYSQYSNPNPNTSTPNSITDLDNNVIAVGDAVTGEVKVTTAEDIVKAGMLPDSGLEWLNDSDDDSRKVVLGGQLDRETILTTSSTNTLAIAGLQNANVGAHKNITVSGTGVLRTTDRISTTAGTNAEQVVLSVALTGNQNLDLTPASAAVLGQVVNVMITSSNETGTLYITGEGTHLTGLSDLGYTEVPNNVLAFGGLEGQKFTFKCVAKDNSYAWEVVSRN